MSMPSLRPPVPVMAALLLVAAASPVAGPRLLPAVRYHAVRDSGFAVPDSIRAMLTRVTALAVEPDSGLYVADPSLGAVLRLTPSGAYRGMVGRRGAGPGEFNSVLLLGLHQDSLWVLDPSQVRLTLLPRSGSTPLTVPLGMSAASLPSGRPQARQGLPSSVLPDGTLLVEEATPDQNGRWLQRFLFHTDRSLEILDTVGRHTLAHSTMVFTYRDGQIHLNQPFGDDPLYGVQSDGSTVVLVDRTVPARGVEGTITLRIWRGPGQPVITREIAYTGKRLPQAAVDSAVDRFFEGGHRRIPDTPVTADSVLSQLFRPAIFPPVEQVRVASDGSIWLQVRLQDSPDGVADWRVLSPRGFEMYQVSLPASFRLLQAGRRMIWGVEGDALDVPLLVRYMVRERPA